MIRTIIIDTEHEKGMLQVRMDPHMTREEFLSAVNAAVSDFRHEAHEKYQKAEKDGRLPWSALFTGCPQSILMRHGIDPVEYGSCWIRADAPPGQAVREDPDERR